MDEITQQRLRHLDKVQSGGNNDYKLLDSNEQEKLPNTNKVDYTQMEQFQVEEPKPINNISSSGRSTGDYFDIVWGTLKPFICPFEEGEPGRALYLCLSATTISILLLLIILILSTG